MAEPSPSDVTRNELVSSESPCLVRIQTALLLTHRDPSIPPRARVFPANPIPHHESSYIVTIDDKRLPLARQNSSDRSSSRLKPAAETPRPFSRKPDLPLKKKSSTYLTDADREQLAAWELNGREIKECYQHGEHVVSL